MSTFDLLFRLRRFLAGRRVDAAAFAYPLDVAAVRGALDEARRRQGMGVGGR